MRGQTTVKWLQCSFKPSVGSSHKIFLKYFSALKSCSTKLLPPARVVSGPAADHTMATSGLDSLDLKTKVADLAGSMEAQYISSPKSLATRLRELAALLDVDSDNADETGPPKKKKKRPDRPFDFSKHRQRYVALEVAYIGGSYHGFAAQDNTDDTIENRLFAALRKTKLIPPDWTVASIRYSRCGRTDAGVSALGQVIALLVRSKAAVDEPEVEPADELEYPRMLNRALPDEIRVLGWAVAPEDFSARFSAMHREYKYFLVQRGQLDMDAMRSACAFFLGEHDFRNFCKVEVKSGVTNFVRTIKECEVVPIDMHSLGGAQLYCFRVKGTAFLYHQVRCMVAVLLMVGLGQEPASIVQQMLDLTTYPRKPQFNMAPEEPLLLFSCGFEGLQWHRAPQETTITAGVLAGLADKHLLVGGLVSQALARVEADRAALPGGLEAKGWRTAGHIPLRRRPTEPSLEERYAAAAARGVAASQAGSVAGSVAERQDGAGEVDMEDSLSLT